MHYLLFYEAVPGYEERRRPFRAEHLRHARAAVERGQLVLAGAYANPIDGALLLFRSDTPAIVEEFARTDPYVVNGLVQRWFVREWTTVVGPTAEVNLSP